MADSYITYDSFVQPESPGYFRRHFDQMFSFSGNELENEGFTSGQGVHQIIHEGPVRTNFDAFSNDSAYSTNPSTKHSPEYTPNAEDGGEDGGHKHSIVPPIIKKGIRKYYEPIVDGGVVYRYEDDPNEYRKARKRIQNRESATRVRNRKKTHVEVLEDEIQILKEEKNHFKIENSRLIAENTMLKENIRMLEKIVAEHNQNHVIEFSESMQDVSRNEQADSVLHIMNNREEEQELVVNQQFNHPGIYRVAPTHNKVKKHMVMLGVFTLLLCVYGLLPRTSTGIVSLVGKFPTSSNGSGNFDNPNSMGVGMNPSQKNPMDRSFEKGGRNKHRGGGWGRGGPDRPKPFHDWLKSQTNKNTDNNTESSPSSSSSTSDSYLWMVEVIVIVCYFAYLTFVGWTVYKNRSDKKEKKTAILHAI